MNNPLGYNIQSFQWDCRWITYAYKTEYALAIVFEHALRSQGHKTRIQTIKDSSILGA